MNSLSNFMKSSTKRFENKKLLILAGQDVHRKMVEAAKDLGCYTIVADYLVDSSAKKIADESSMISIVDVDGIVEFCKKKKIDGVVNCCNDLASRIVQQVNEKMKWPNIGTWEQVETMTNKGLFKKLCLNNNVDVVEEYDEDDLKKGTIKFPVLVKPIDSRGSRGSTICDNLSELEFAVSKAKEASSSGRILIERYMGGHQELSITYLVIDGVPHLISVGDRHSGRREDNVDKILSCMIQPSWSIDLYLKNVDAKVKNMLIKLGLKNTAVFMQGFVDGETVRMFDPAIRFPGNEYERAFTKANGFNPMDSIISYALNGKMDDFDGRYEGSYNLKGKVAVQYMINCRPGTISKFIGIKEIEHHPRVVYVGYKYDVGATITNTGDTNHRVFDITFVVDRNEKSVNEVVDFVNEKLRVLDKNGDDMIVSKFDFRKVYSRYDWPKE